MPRIRLLVSVAGDGVAGDAGDVLDVSGALASVWADGERAELVRDAAPRTPEDGAPVVERAAHATTARKRGRPAATKPPRG